MNWSGFAKFLTGFTLAIALLFFAGVNITRYLITRLTAPPPKPIFPNDSPAAVNRPAAPTPSPSPTESAAPSPTPSGDGVSSPASSPSPSPSPTDEDGYEARVTEPIGLVLRSEPSQESERLGGVEFEQDLIVLETSPDGEWLRVRLPDNDTEGWVRAGNVERTESR